MTQIVITEPMTESIIKQMRPILRKAGTTPKYGLAIIQILSEYKEMKFGKKKVRSRNSQKPDKGNK